MKVWVDEIAKWVVAEPLPPVEYRMDEGALEALLARPLAPGRPMAASHPALAIWSAASRPPRSPT